MRQWDTDQHKLPHIDDADESGGGDVGGENHLGVLEPADQAGGIVSNVVEIQLKGWCR